MKNENTSVQFEGPREHEINKTEEDVWVEELTKSDREEESSYLPERMIVQTPNIK